MDELHRQVLHVRRLKRDTPRSARPRRHLGPIEDRYNTAGQFRWWWIPVGVMLFVALVILI